MFQMCKDHSGVKGCSIMQSAGIFKARTDVSRVLGCKGAGNLTLILTMTLILTLIPTLIVTLSLTMTRILTLILTLTRL